jgi:hypothetical protein
MTLALHASERDAAQFAVDEWHELFERSVVTLSPRQEQSSDPLGVESDALDYTGRPMTVLRWETRLCE